MATLTIRMPDDKADRLKTLAEHRDVSVNKLMEELATFAIAQFDTENRFRARAARGSAARGLALLDELDAHYAASPHGFNDGRDDAYEPQKPDTPNKKRRK